MNPSSPRRSLFLCITTFLFIITTLVSSQNTYQGCYTVDSNNPLVQNDTSIYQSIGRCSGQICGPKKYAAFGLTSGSQCWCGNAIPGNQVAGDHCNLACPGYPNDTCTSLPLPRRKRIVVTGRRRNWIY